MVTSNNNAGEQSQEKLYDLSTLLQFSDDDPGFIKDIIKLFITNGRQDLVALETSIANNEISEIFQVAHRMKSSMHTMGIHSAETAIKRIDFCSRNNQDIQEIPILAAEVKQTLLIVFDQLMTDFNIDC